jgi:uncharacterized ion transporter superfamily protein YfcC
MKLKAPNVFVLIGGILLLMGVMTWILPAGEFEREQRSIQVGQSEDQTLTREVVIPGTFRLLPPEEANPQDPFELLKSPLKGFEDGAEVIGFILLVGGAFGVLHATGSMMAVLRWVTAHAGETGRIVMIPLVMVLFSAGGALFGMAEETIPFVMVTVPLAVAMRYDVITGIAIPFVGSQAGFAAAFLNPFTLGIAKGIAEQPMGEGQGYRMICWVLVTGICIAMVMWHALRVAKDPAKSPTPELDESWRASLLQEAAAGGDDTSGMGGVGLRTTDVFVLFGFLGSMVALGVGALYYDWYVPEISAMFLAMALICGLLGRLSLGKIADAFVAGAKDLASTALLVAFARAIVIVARDGKIIDTLLNGLAGSLEGLGPLWGTECMFAVQTFINFFVVSGSGQAALTMPVMVPLADLLEIHRENAILAYQFGDGFTNMIVPTNPVLIGVISVARLSYGTWFRWMIKYQLLLFLLGMILLAFSPFHTA